MNKKLFLTILSILVAIAVCMANAYGVCHYVINTPQTELEAFLMFWNYVGTVAGAIEVPLIIVWYRKDIL